MAEYDTPKTKTTVSTGGNPRFYIAPKIQHLEFVSWRSVFAGFLISMLCFTLLITLGMGVGGVTFDPGKSGLESWTVTSSIWVVVAAMIALFVGAYCASRLSNYINTMIGAVQGTVIAAVFFALILWQMGMALGWVSTSTPTSDILGRVGWFVFAFVLLGTGSAIIGGGLGSKENYRHPLETNEIERIETRRTAP